MANFNTLIKRKQYLWLGLILVGGAAAVGGGLYLSELNLNSDEEAPAQGEPAPDMTGVVDSSFNSKVEQHATTEMQATAADLNKRFASLQGEVDLLSKARSADQIRIDKLSNENAAMQEQLKALGVRPAVSGGEPAPTPPSPPPGPEGEPQPASYPPQSGAAVPPPTAFYPGNGVTLPPQVSYQSVPVPNQIQRKTFNYNRGKKGRELPYIPSGSFAKSILIEGADANASVTGNQLAFIDLFYEGMNNTNFNMAVCGTSGAGKTGLIQPLIRSVLDSGGFAWVFDMGDGYKSLCENMGGVYLDGDSLKFNPFANILDDANFDLSAERIRDQMSVMASPNGNLDEVHEGLLLQAVRAAWLSKRNKARIDDVVAFLRSEKDSEEYADSPGVRSRLDDMIILLDQYTVNGLYGEYFNSDEPSLHDDARMVVLELGGLESRQSLLVAVMFSLIIYIENRMYQSPRSLKKLNVIDEGWRLLDFKNEKVGTFIEKGYRTARRHTGAYITITQNIVDFDSPTASSAARAAWGNSSYKAILKQSAKEFAKYNQLYPDQFSKLEKDMINGFGSAKEQWFSSFMLQVEANCSWHRLFVDPLSRAMYSSKGPDFEYMKARREEGVDIHDAVYGLACRNFKEEMAELESRIPVNDMEDKQ